MGTAGCSVGQPEVAGCVLAAVAPMRGNHQQLQGFPHSPINDGSDDDAEEDVGEIDSGDEDDDDASASDEEA
ncbi:TPA: hypothetical protein ACH3X2_009695 [Trebouxia sp. C0005]